VSSQKNNAKRVKRYIDLIPIGRGGMGELFRAYDQRDQKIVAIKIIHAEHSEERHSIKRFSREVAALAKLDHPNIVKSFDFFEHQNVLYYTMEYIDGQNLVGLTNKKPLGPRKAVELFTHLASALQAVHDAGIIHRDIKADNVMVANDGTPKLVDFGLVSLEKKENLTTLTKAGDVVGTIIALPPEVLMGKPHDIRGDIYQLGLTLYVALVGEYPFNATTLLSYTGGYIDIDPPSSRVSLCDAQLDLLVLSTLDRDPSKRPQTAAAFGDLLKAWLNPAVSQVTLPSIKIHPPKKSYTLAAMAVIAVTALALLGALYLFQRSEPRKIVTAIEAPSALTKTPIKSPDVKTPHPPSPEILPPPTKSTAIATAPPPVADKTQANKLYSQGQWAYQAQKFKRAVDFYTRAVKAGNADASFALATCAENGIGTPQDQALALAHYRTAARTGHTTAQAYLARCYEDGLLDLVVSRSKHTQWLRKAAEGGHAESQFRLAEKYASTQSESNSDTARKAFEWYLSAAEQDYLPALYKVGCCHEDGIGTAPNPAKAKELFERAAARNFPPALRKLGRIFQDSTGTFGENTSSNSTQDINSLIPVGLDSRNKLLEELLAEP